MTHKKLFGGLLIASFCSFGGVAIAADSPSALTAEEKASWKEYLKLNEEERKAYREKGRQSYEKNIEELRRKGKSDVSQKDKERFAKLRAMSKEERAALFEQNRKKYEANRKKAKEERLAKMSKGERKAMLDQLKSRGKVKQKK